MFICILMRNYEKARAHVKNQTTQWWLVELKRDWNRAARSIFERSGKW